jgi:ubiquinone/menaquinone biosynthesis C-methylase UbiE
MGPEHQETVRRQFARQAPAFEDPTRSFARDDVLAWIVANTPMHPDDAVLEVAAGTAIVSRALSPLARLVVAVDLTPEMLAEGKRVADGAGLRNVVFQEADATALPFLDASFDRVVSRLAVHHFEDPSRLLAEMVRVCRPDGTVTIIDMVAPDAASAELFNDLEHRRDPSHTRALTLDQLRDAVTAAGARVTHHSSWDNVLIGSRWLEQTDTPADDAALIHAAWDDEISGGPVTGMQPRRTDTGIQFTHRWELLVAERR